MRKPPWKKTEPERRLDWLLARVRTRRAPARKPGIMGALGAADQAVLRFLRTKAPHDPATERFGKGLGLIGEWAAIWVAIGVAGAATDPEKRTRWLIGAAMPRKAWPGLVKCRTWSAGRRARRSQDARRRKAWTKRSASRRSTPRTLPESGKRDGDPAPQTTRGDRTRLRR